MKKTTSFVSNKILIFAPTLGRTFPAMLVALLVLCSCASDKGKIMGRPPGVRTSEAENSRNKKNRDTEQKKGKTHFTDDNIVDWDADVAWSDEKSIDVWNSDDQQYSPIFEIEGWPFQEPGSNFRVRWKGGSDSVRVYEKPTLKGKVLPKEISFEKGEEIGWVSSHVAVLSPSIYTAKEDILIEGFDVFSKGFLTGDDGFSKTLKKGQKIRLLLYAGDSLCYLGFSGKAIETLCPTPEAFRGRFKGRDLREQMQPASRMWWIELEGAKGWIVLDSMYIVEIR